MTMVAVEKEHGIKTAPERGTGGNRLEALHNRLVHAYDDKARNYDAARAVNAGVDFYFAMSYATIDALLGPTDEKTVHLDMPVGTGRFLFYLRDRGRRHRMNGIDISPGMLKVCHEAAARRGDDIELSVGDAFHLPVADDSVDILTGLRLFHLFPTEYWPAMIAEMRRVLRPGGMLITEMRNMIRGMACRIAVRAFRERRARHPHTFVAPLAARRLFDAWTEVRMQGVGLDGLARLYRVAPALGRGVHALESRFPVRYLSKTLLIRARKPVD